MKCYGVAKAGKNDCDALDHKKHTCGGLSRRNDHPGDWTLRDADECKKLGGLTEEEARKKLGL